MIVVFITLLGDLLSVGLTLTPAVPAPCPGGGLGFPILLCEQSSAPCCYFMKYDYICCYFETAFTFFSKIIYMMVEEWDSSGSSCTFHISYVGPPYWSLMTDDCWPERVACDSEHVVAKVF